MPRCGSQHQQEQRVVSALTYFECTCDFCGSEWPSLSIDGGSGELPAAPATWLESPIVERQKLAKRQRDLGGLSAVQV